MVDLEEPIGLGLGLGLEYSRGRYDLRYSQGVLPATIKGSTGKVIHWGLEETIVPGSGRHLFSSSKWNKFWKQLYLALDDISSRQANGANFGIKTLIFDDPCLMLRNGATSSLANGVFLHSFELD